MIGKVTLSETPWAFTEVLLSVCHHVADAPHNMANAKHRVPSDCIACAIVQARTGSRFSPLRLAGDLDRAVSRGLNVHSAASFASASAAMASLFWRARSLRVSSARGSGCAGHFHHFHNCTEQCLREWPVVAACGSSLCARTEITKAG